jgi:8-amino-7-oxononanoate synthase
VKRSPAALSFLAGALKDLADNGLLRDRTPPATRASTSFCSNDYLGLADRPCPMAMRGSGSARLVIGERKEHREAEAAIAWFLGREDALVFTSGYAANVGLLSALAARGDLIVSDALNHASIIDGIRLSRADVVVTPHLDVNAVERALAAPRSGSRHRFVVTESYFSMDADAPDLGALREVCDRAGAVLVVDEAHALGILGPSGRGLCSAAGVEADAIVGTFGKAFGAGGAFVAGCPELVSWLWNRARSFVFSTGLSPAVAAAAAEGVRIAENDHDRRQRVLDNSERFRAGLAQLGLRALGFGHIVPWVVGEPAEAVQLAAQLCARGVLVRAIRPPTVPEGTSRLRFTFTAAHRVEDVDHALATIAEVLRRNAARKRTHRTAT